MMFQAKIERRNESVALIVSKDVLTELEATSAEVLYLTKAPNNALTLSSYSPEVVRQIEIGIEVMEEYDEAFRALAR